MTLYILMYTYLYSMMKNIFAVLALLVATSAVAQEEDARQESVSRLLHDIEYKVEMQGSFSKGKTPLWLNANKFGLSSLDKTNGYLRGAIERPLKADEGRKWGVGYGVDLAVPVNYTSNVVVQQAYAEGRWLHGTLTVGAKEYPMELKNNELSSGSQTLGRNARPIPQVRLALPEYWTVPLTCGWLHLKGHIAYGKLTDDDWEGDFTARSSRYTEDVLYHSKAGYLKIGNEDVFCPWSFEVGLEMASLFGGRSYLPNGDGTMRVYNNGTGLKAYLDALIPGGAEANETQYKNVEGDQLGSWVMRINYENEDFMAAVYADKFFEDHSSMFQLDYDGYGSGDEWDVRKDHKYLLYDFKDWMLGAEVKLKWATWVRGIVFEYLYTKYQSGPIYHDHTPSMSDHIGGRDNFYNHGMFAGWQHWGQVIGNPLYRSPIYNTDGTIAVENNRFMAFHLGLSGEPYDNLRYRLLGTYQEGWGTYDNPYTKKHHNVSVLAEAAYTFTGRKLEGWSIRGGCGMDFGHILGHNYGFQLTISKTGLFSL